MLSKEKYPFTLPELREYSRMKSDRAPSWPLSWTWEGEGKGRREGVKWERLGRGAARHPQNHHTLSLTTTRPATHCWPFRDPTLARQFVTTLTLSPPPYLGRDTSVANRFDHGSHERSESGLQKQRENGVSAEEM